jgi:hypothetical protein
MFHTAAMKFDSGVAAARVDRFWALNASFGHEHGAVHTYLNEIVSDRYVLVNGVQLLHDELQFSAIKVPGDHADVRACGADLSLPSVITTLAHTNCGDRIHQGEATTLYQQMVAGRFACKSEIGENKVEAFSPTGGGTDDGSTLAHVTVAHQLDEPIRKALYEGNASSYVLVNIDLKTHVGLLSPENGNIAVGITQESKWREPRAACGAIVGTLKAFNEKNGVHRRIRQDLGEANFEFLRREGVHSKDGVDVTAAVAASIVAIQGMENTAKALESELDERGLAHLTASVTVNRPHFPDTIVYLSRATVFNGATQIQGFGTDAKKYTGEIIDWRGERRLLLGYDKLATNEHHVRRSSYAARPSILRATTDHHEPSMD